MEQYYTNEVFLKILLVVLSLSGLVPYLILAENRKRKPLTVLLILLLCLYALTVVSPLPGLKELSLPILIVLLPLSLLWVFLFFRALDKPEFEHYMPWIIDTLRESVLVFDPFFNLQGNGRRIKGLSEEESLELIERLRQILKKGEKGSKEQLPSGEGVLRSGRKVFRYRFRPVSRGCLVTLLDFSEEQNLLDDLEEKNSYLERRRHVLEATEGLELASRREQYRQKISSGILNLVRDELETLQELMDGSGDIPAVLSRTQEALSDIRLAVGRLSSGEKKT